MSEDQKDNVFLEKELLDRFIEEKLKPLRQQRKVEIYFSLIAMIVISIILIGLSISKEGSCSANALFSAMMFILLCCHTKQFSDIVDMPHHTDTNTFKEHFYKYDLEVLREWLKFESKWPVVYRKGENVL